MSAREWKPGDVGMWSYLGHTEVALRVSAGGCSLRDSHGRRDHWHLSNGGWSGEAEHVRPLVALDLPDGAKAGWPVLVNALRMAEERTGLELIFGDLIRQIEAQVGTPCPPEPERIGALVTDKDGDTWARHCDGLWTCLNSSPGVDKPRPWADLFDRYGPLEVRA